MKVPDKTRADLGWGALLDELAARAHTRRGALLARALEPFDSLDDARARHAEVSEARALRDVGGELPFAGVRDLDEALPRAEKGGVLDGALLCDVGATAAAGARLKRHLNARSPRLYGRALLLDELDELSEPILRSFDEGLVDGKARLNDRASQALGGLRRRAQVVRDELEKKCERLLDAGHVAEHLQDKFFTQREDRYVIPVRVDARSRVRGIVHGTSQSGQTVFVEPEEIVELNNRLKLAELEVAEEERRILGELSAMVADALPRLRANLDILAHLDLVDAAAKLSSELRAAPPELVEEGAVDLRRARHPLMILSGRACVPNDILVGWQKTLVISGPNAGGKTVALKTAGLASLMALAGLHVAAQEGSKIPRLSSVLTDVGDDQSLERNLSTFSAHVLHLSDFIGAAQPGVLVLLDEVAVGTDPEQGAALAQAVLEALAERGATTIVTTHYDRLKALAPRDARFANASVGFDVEKLQPTFELHLGVPGASGAVVVARRLGLPEAVCARATTLAGESTTGLERLLLDVEAERKRIAREREMTEAERAEAERARAEAERRAEEAKEKLAAARRGAHDQAVQTLQAARAELDRTRAVLRRSGGKITSAEVDSAKRGIDEAARAVRESAPEPPPPPGRPATLEELKPGVEVFVQKLGGKAEVVAVKGKKVTVQAGILKATVETEDIRILDGKTQKSARSQRGHNAFDVAISAEAPMQQRGYATLDVRGERVDVAMGLAEKFLDDALRSGREAVLIVHGHGTGKLRDALRAELRRFPGVSAVRAGQQEEGGDGVTLVTLG
jgi:DNA mismatch repair protein MutS2